MTLPTTDDPRTPADVPTTGGAPRGRPLPAPGHSGVDFEERVDFDRLRRYRVGTRLRGVGIEPMWRLFAVRFLQHPVHDPDLDRRRPR